MSRRPTEQLSIPYFRSSEGRSPEGHAFLFTRDLPLGVMPIGGTRDHPEYTARLEPKDEHLSLWLAHALDPDARRGELADALAEFVQTATQYLAHFGEVFYEIVPMRATASDDAAKPTDEQSEQLDNDAESTPSDELPPLARLIPLPPGKVWRVPSGYLQIVPKADRDQIRKPFVRLPTARIWHLKLPPNLGSPRAHRRLLKRLERLDPLRPDFGLQVGEPGRSAGFDFAVLRAACDIEQERATKEWGRILSITQIDGTTEYLYLARTLQWRLTQAVIREHVISQLNCLLDRLGAGHRIAVAGLPTMEEIAHALQRMHAGEITVAQAMDATKL